MEDDFAQTKKGGRQQKQKEHKETILVTAEQAKENKKKKKQANMGFNLYGGGPTAEQEEEEKGQVQEQEEKQQQKKHQKGGKKKGKGKQQQQSDDEEETKEVQPSQANEEESKDEPTKNSSPYPLEVVYCKICSFPPEFCMYEKKDYSDCKNWLKTTHPDLFVKVYPEEADKPEGSTEQTGEEQKEVKPQKKKKKVTIGQADNGVMIYKSRRGAKKCICNVVGLQAYGVNLKEMSKLMSKRFACSSSVVTDDKYGECIQLQGDIELRFEEFAEAEFTKYNIPLEKVKFEDTDKKKKKAAAAAALQQQDDE